VGRARHPSAVDPCPRRGGRGFTLTELLVALAVTTVLIGMLVPAVWSWRQEEERAAQVAALIAETNGFVTFVVSEMRRAHAVVPEGSRLDLYTYDGQRITYRLDHAGRIVRTVNGLGYTILCQDVADVRFAEAAGGVRVTLQLSKGAVRHAETFVLGGTWYNGPNESDS
jgi:prepilin-type N-terminal cleavage/methylation domain